MNGYQLLNQVGAGGTLSSLFTILSLFTENVKISWQDGDRLDEQLDVNLVASPAPVHLRPDSDVSHLDLSATSASRSRAHSVSSSGSTVHAGDVSSPRERSPSGERLFVRTSSGVTSTSGRNSNSASTITETQSHYGVVARAAEDSTLAVIPAEAFQRLTKLFPKAAAHIVQGVLMCCSLHWARLTIFSNLQSFSPDFHASHSTQPTTIWV